jgi:hypothetical protein
MNNFSNFQPFNYNHYHRQPLVCYNCGQFGHKFRNCYYFWMGQQQSQYYGFNYYNPQPYYYQKPLTCFNCGGFGHKKAICPSLPRRSYRPNRSNLIQVPREPMQQQQNVQNLPGSKAKVVSTKTTHSDYIDECKLLKIPKYDQFSDEQLKQRILAHITQNLKLIETLPKEHQLKFLARHELIPEEQLNKLTLKDDLTTRMH